jgi:hypothetical protein
VYAPRQALGATSPTTVYTAAASQGPHLAALEAFAGAFLATPYSASSRRVSVEVDSAARADSVVSTSTAEAFDRWTGLEAQLGLRFFTMAEVPAWRQWSGGRWIARMERI